MTSSTEMPQSNLTLFPDSDLIQVKARVRDFDSDQPD
jgi:hypothetical protein